MSNEENYLQHIMHCDLDQFETITSTESVGYTTITVQTKAGHFFSVDVSDEDLAG